MYFGDPKITIAYDSPDSKALSCSTGQRDLDVVSTAYPWFRHLSRRTQIPITALTRTLDAKANLRLRDIEFMFEGAEPGSDPLPAPF
jgi:hypothetical protein